MGYIGMCRGEEYDFQAVYTGIGYINQRVWVQYRVSLSRKLISWPLKNIKKSNRFCFGWTVLVISVVSGKQLL